MLVNSLLRISFLGEDIILTHYVFKFVSTIIPIKIFKVTNEPLLPFKDVDTVKLR